MRLKALLVALTLSLTGCAIPAPVSQPTPEPTISASEPVLRIVASTNVWGDITKFIAGDDVEVVSIIKSFGQDPHSYEASARDQLAVNAADLVVANGGGYDSFIEQLAQAAGSKEIIFAYEPEELDKEPDDGHNHDHGHENEHVWYDFHAVEDFANRLAGKLSTLDPDNRLYYSDRLTQFLNLIEIFEDRVAVLAQKYQGDAVLSTEPVADYLLAAFGLENLTPKSFSQAIEEELDVSPRVLLEVRQLISSKRIKLVVSNLQTGSKQVDELLALAKTEGIAVVELSELLPEGIGYIDWMENNIGAIEAALR